MRVDRKHRSHWLAASAGLTLLIAALAAVPALAHARYLRSEPGDGAIVSAPPERIDIWFTQELFRRAGENWIHVENPEGDRAELGEAQVDDDDRAHLSVELLPELAPGSYRVSWRNLSADDGDSDQGEFSFTYNPQAAVTSTPLPEHSPTTPASPTASPAPTAAPEATLAPGSTDAPTPDSDGAGCGVVLIPVAGVIAFGGPAALKRRSHR